LKNNALYNLDYAVIAGYFLLVFSIAAMLIRRDNKKAKGSATGNYFLGGRNMGWFIIGASLFSSNIGSEHLVGLAGAGASGNFPAAQMEILAAFMLLILGWFFVPFYMRSGVFTMPQFLELRYSKWSKNYLSWVSIIAYVLTKISVTIAAGGIIFTTFLNVDFWTGSILIVIATGLYTIFGGLKAVAYTDMIQMFVLIGGSVALTFYGLDALGGWEVLKVKTDDTYLSLWRGINHESFPWTGVLFGAPILGIWYWCTDQFIVQRTLAARNIDQARKGTIFAGYLKLLPLFIFLVPGVIAYALSTGPNPVLTFPVIDGKVVYDAALPLMSMQLLPAGLKGLVVAGLIAALMSSLSSVFNSCSTLFTLDIYKQYFPETTEKKLVKVGQIATAGLVLLGLAWIPMLQALKGGLFEKIQSIQSYISPPIAAVFLFGLLFKKLNASGAKAALLTGAILGSLRLILEINQVALPLALNWFVAINFLHFALFLFIVCTLVLIGFSLNTPQEPSALAKTLTLNIESNPINLTSKLNVALSLILVLLILIIWYVFK
jgi:SSS family solute:Na+ symporter